MDSPRYWRAIWALLLFCLPVPVWAQLAPANVLVVYNSTSVASTGVKDHYLAARPGVQAFDLNDASLLPGQVSYTDFKSKIRDPLRTHLTTSNLLGSIYVIVLTKDIPHRIADINDANVGDSPSSVSIPNYTATSVDSELTLLFQDLDTGENDADEDSQADSYVANPYFGATSTITGFGRNDIEDTLEFRIQTDGFNVRHWQFGRRPLFSSRIYLVARLDGNSVDDVKHMIDRAKNPVYDPTRNAAIFDRDVRSTQFDNGDFDAAAALLSSWNNVRNNASNSFYIGRTGAVAESNTIREPKLVAYLASYGFNHNGGSFVGYINTYQGQLVDGAIFNTYESYNGRAFGGLGGRFNHGQLSSWIANGGTFGVGHVWEPFAFAVVRNEEIVRSFVEGSLTWIEAAYAGMRTLSWQGVVLGDPLAKAQQSTSAFEQWQWKNFGSTTSASALPTANPDLDTRNNLLEYALSSDPNTGDPAPVITTTTNGSGTSRTITFETTRDTCRDDVSLSFEGTSNLIVWSPIVSTIVSTNLNLETIRFEITVSSSTRFFTRLSANLP